MEAPVETTNKRTEVTSSVFGEIERMVSATQAGFEVTQNRVDPVEFWQILGLAATSDDGPMLAARIGYPCKTAQAIGSDYTTWREVFVSPVDIRFARKTRNRSLFIILIYRGRPSALSEIAPTNGIMFTEPRPA